MLKKITALLLTLLLAITATGCNRAGTNSQEPALNVEDILQSVRDAYGEDYLPVMEISPDMLENMYGLPPDLYEQAVGETPMMTTHPDTVIIVKAAAGKGDEVEKILQELRDHKINNELQYPMNLPKVNNTQVVRNGSYVAFLLVGAINDDLDVSGEAADQFAKEQAQKGVDAFQAMFR